MSNSNESVWVVGITGASGLRYGIRLLDVLPTLVREVHVVFSESALRVLHDEEGISLSSSNLNYQSLFARPGENVHFYNPRDIGARIASGSMRAKGMVVVPCSMSTLGAIAHGVPSNLVHRAADVTLKEGRQLIIVPRESPLSAIHLENMLTLSRHGVKIVPAMPGFYNKPQSVSELVDQFVMRILDSMGIENSLGKRWREPTSHDQ